MTEGEAREWIGDHFGAEALLLLDHFVALLTDENSRQNLISPATVTQVWTRHVLDSAQLVPLAPALGQWLDIGTGGGFPGLVVAILRPAPTVMVEPRRRRAAFLAHCVEALSLRQAEVLASKVEAVAVSADVISARAVASVENLLHAALPCAKKATRWLLPRGRFTETDLVQLRRRWEGAFHVEQSLSDAGSSILVLDRVSRR